MTDDNYEYPEADESEIFATILLDELQELIDDSAFLNHLRANGVDNWEGYDEALQSFKKENQDGSSFFLVPDPK